MKVICKKSIEININNHPIPYSDGKNIHYGVFIKDEKYEFHLEENSFNEGWKPEQMNGDIPYKYKYIYVHNKKYTENKNGPQWKQGHQGVRFHLDKINRQIRTPRNIYAASCF
jgi:hypothetical protein